MPRTTNSVASRKRRRKIIKAAKGYFGKRKNVYTIAKNAVEKGMAYSYIHRKQKKRNFRKLWITRINAASRLNGLSYSRLMNQLKKSNIDLNRKMLSQIAILDSATFKQIIDAT